MCREICFRSLYTYIWHHRYFTTGISPLSLLHYRGIIAQQIKYYSLRVEEKRHPALFIVGGDVGSGNPRLDHFFSTRHGIFCENDGKICNYKGTCLGGALAEEEEGQEIHIGC
jgi:hypothetical protein